MLIKNITELIGNTPLLEIPERVHRLKNIKLYAKLELFNPWGSFKDRTAWGILQPHLDELNKKIVIESSSGNLAKSLQMISSINGSRMKTLTNRIKVPEVKDLLKLLKVEIQEFPGKSDCYDPNDPNDPLVYIQQEIALNKDKYIYTNQYFNDLNRKAHYDTTGEEVLNDLGSVDYFVSGLGTTGSTLGIGQKLKEKNPNLKVIGVVSEKDDYIPGIRDSDEALEVGLFMPKFYSKIISVNSNDALEYMMVLILQLGILAGPTSGASFCGIKNYFGPISKNFKNPKKVVFLVCDGVEGYISYIKKRKPAWFGEKAVVSWKDKIKAISSIEIDTSTNYDWIKKSGPLAIDLRQPISFKIAHIPNSINLPFDYLDSMLNETNPFCIKQKLLFICSVGEKSALIATYLKKKKIKAFSVKGGIVEWRKNGLPLERNL